MGQKNGKTINLLRNNTTLIAKQQNVNRDTSRANRRGLNVLYLKNKKILLQKARKYNKYISKIICMSTYKKNTFMYFIIIDI